MSGATTYSTFEVRLRAVHAVLDEELPITVVARAYATDRSTVHRWITRYEDNGKSGLLRRSVSGRPRKLEEVDKESLKRLILAPAKEFGFETDFWTTRRLIQVFQSEFNVVVSKQTVNASLA